MEAGDGQREERGMDPHAFDPGAGIGRDLKRLSLSSGAGAAGTTGARDRMPSCLLYTSDAADD